MPRAKSKGRGLGSSSQTCRQPLQVVGVIAHRSDPRPASILPRSIVYYLVSGALLACSKLASRLPAYHLECMSRQSNGMLYSLRAQCPSRDLTPPSALERLSGASDAHLPVLVPGGIKTHFPKQSKSGIEYHSRPRPFSLVQLHMSPKTSKFARKIVSIRLKSVPHATARHACRQN